LKGKSERRRKPGINPTLVNPRGEGDESSKSRTNFYKKPLTTTKPQKPI
jgi:hypothetical protein